MDTAQRKLVRPSLIEVKDPMNAQRRNNHPKKAPPPEQTNAENFYYVKQMQARTPMVLVLQDGEEIHGIIEWYDKLCLKIKRESAPNLLVYKPAIKYMYKANQSG